MPYLLDRTESAQDRNLWSAAITGAVILTYAAAEWAARKVPPWSLFAGLTLLAALCGLALWRMGSPDRAAGRLLAAAAVAAAGAGAALVHRHRAAVPRGAAGWFAGGALLLLVLGFLSRAANVPVPPMAVGAAIVPVAALAVVLHVRLFLSGHGITFPAVILLAGSALFALCVQESIRAGAAAPPAESTGADDSGAYD
jgi:hypothetical protein